MNVISSFLASAVLLLPSLSQAAQLLVLNKADATLVFIDPTTDEVHATIPTGEGPHEIELSSDGRLAFVSNYGAQNDGHSVSIVDVAGRKELQRVDLGELRRPHGLSFASGRLYFTSERARKIGRLDPATGALDWSFATEQDGTHMLLVARDAKTVYTTNMQSNTVSIIAVDGDRHWQQTLVSVGAGPEALDASPDGRELWVAHSRDGHISVIDTATKKVAATFDAKTKRSNRLKFTPDGRWVLVSDLGAGELLIIDARTRTERARLALGRAPTGILVPAAGKQAYIAVSGENRVAVIDLNAFRVAKTIATGNSPDGMAWLP